VAAVTEDQYDAIAPGKELAGLGLWANKSKTVLERDA